MERKRCFGIDYNFIIELDEQKNYCLDVWAMHKTTKKVSPINNINIIISEIQPENNTDELYYESSWVFSDKALAKMTYNKVVVLFQRKLFMKFLELFLDEDRQIGGWNSDYDFHS